MKRLHAFIRGEVQGVFFRSTTYQWGNSLGLKGFVRNLPDGRVEVVAEGPEAKLKELLENLQAGPPSAHVEKVDAQWEEARSEFSSFEVRY